MGQLFTTQEIFRLVHIESIRRLQMKCDFKSERVENIVEKEKMLIAVFSPFSSMFSKAFVVIGKTFSFVLTHSHTMTPFDAPWKQAF